MLGTYFNIDCMELMADLKDKEVDLAIVDPPYGIKADTKNSSGKLQSNKSSAISKDYGSQKWDTHIPNEEYFEELKRVSKHQIIFGANYFGLVGGFLYWHKNVTMPTYSSGELAWLSFSNKVDFIELTWHGMIQHDMKKKEFRIHPTQKPVKLYEWLLSNYAKPNDLILDTHCGSASSLIACENLGFKYIASELDKDYYSQSLQRLEAHLSQGKLFQRAGRDEIRLEQPSMFA